MAGNLHSYWRCGSHNYSISGTKSRRRLLSRMPKICSHFNYNSDALGGESKAKKKRAENTDNDQKAVLSLGHRGLFFFLFLRGRKHTPPKKTQEVGNASTITVICIEKKEEENHPNSWPSCCERPFLTMFARMNELGGDTDSVTSHRWCRSTRTHFGWSITSSHREDGISAAAVPSAAPSSGVARS